MNVPRERPLTRSFFLPRWQIEFCEKATGVFLRQREGSSGRGQTRHGLFLYIFFLPKSAGAGPLPILAEPLFRLLINFNVH
jgi:hypothetical protein